MTALGLLTSILFAVAFFAVVLIVHELGHYLMARWLKIRTLRFSIGFGRPIVSWMGKTQWTIGWIPLGGYVSLLDTRQHQVPTASLKDAYDRRPIYQRALVLAMGPLMNGILALACFYGAFQLGYPQYVVKAEKVITDSPAAIAGLNSEDTIRRIGERAIHDWLDVSIALLDNIRETQLAIEVDNGVDSRTLLLTLPPVAKQDGLQLHLLARMGIEPNQRERLPPSTPMENLTKTLDRVIQVIQLNGQVIVGLLSQDIALSNLLGPLGAFQFAMLLMSESLAIIFHWIAVFSVAVMVMNSLPIPGLDGGQLLFLAVEKLRGKPLSLAYQGLFHRLAVIFLVVFFIQLTVNDISRWLQSWLS